MTDKYQSYGESPSTPASASDVIAPHDINALMNISKAIYIGSGGTIILRLVNDSSDRIFTNLPAGGILPVRASHVRATGTTAGDLVALL